MSDGFASYGFLSWLRRGIATGLTSGDAASLGHPRVALPVQVSVSGAPGGNENVAVNGLVLFGPGEVIGFDSRAVARVWPLPNALDAESNYFPLIELVPADLPWQYTPAAAEAARHRLRPWMCLLALKDDEFALDMQPNGAPRLKVNPQAPLPKLSQAWAWAHVQVAGGKAFSPTTAADVTAVRDQLANQTGTLVARLLSPRRLDPRSHYTAFVVPVFARGTKAGLGTPPDDSVDALTPSWTDQDATSRANPLELPIYYSWSFSTSDFGDFEYLVRQLKGNPLPDTVGVRPMDVASPGGGLPGAAPGISNVLGVEGALRAANSGSKWLDNDRRTWTSALAALLGSASPLQVALPLYGRWHAARTAIDATLNPSQPMPWFDDLNTDPRLRVAAALGVAVVQAEQQQLMASAWQQGAGIQEINAELRQAQLGREATRRIYARHLRAMATQPSLQVTGPLHARVQFTSTDCASNVAVARTCKAWLAGSPVPRGFFDPQWRRVSRAWGGPHRRHAAPEGDAQPVNLLDGLMNGLIVAAPAPPMPSGMATMTAAGIDPVTLLAALAPPPRGPSKPAPTDYYSVGDQRPKLSDPPGKSDNKGTNWGPFGRAVTDLAAALAFRPRAAIPKCPVAIGPMNSAIITALDPNTTMAAAYAGRLQFAPAGAWHGTDPLGPVYLAPSYPMPAFEPLRKMSQDWIIPGLDACPPNTIAVLEANQRFIEAYMVGLNFELGRELLWNGLPTDQRGSYFREFWDHGSAITPSGQIPDPSARYDIDVITQWTKPLGQNPNPHGLPAGSLFLLIRGDLLHRYPNAQFYATRAIIGNDGKRTFPDPDATPPPKEKFPLFSGTLEPDVSFFAFDLTYEEAWGDPNNPNSPSNPGWYFVLQEHSAATRFGLHAAGDTSYNVPVSEWTQMNWGSLATDADALVQIGYIDLDAALPDTAQAHNTSDPTTTGLAWKSSQGSRAADIAYLTMRDPVRVAIHASGLLRRTA